MAKKDEVKVEQETDTVAPIESVKEKPKANGEQCWNCKNHGEENYLDDAGYCAVCGFDKETLFNLDLEAEKASAKQRALNAK